MYLKIRNKNNGRTFDTTQEEYNRLIANEGLANNYEVIDSGEPIEVRRMREKKAEPVKSEPIEEIVIEKKKSKKGSLTEIKKE